MARAVEIQSESARGGGGMSEDELRLAASELGVGPEAIEAAVRSVDAEPAPKFSFLGVPLIIEEDRAFEGSISDESWEYTVAELRKFFRQAGTVSQRGVVREWLAPGPFQQSLVVTAIPSGSTVRLKVSIPAEQWLQLALCFLLMPSLMFILMSLLHPMRIVAILAVDASIVVGLRQLLVSTTRKRCRQVGVLLDGIESSMSDRT